MPAIELKDIRNYACHGVNLRIEPGEFLVLLGPNGAGKSTLLNIIAGLREYEGSVKVSGRSVDHLPPQKRKVGYLFQDLALFPHLDAASNIAYGLKAAGWPEKSIASRVEELLDMMRVRHLADCHPGRLSGGEKQRVALARALAPKPEILLLDEPMSSMDLQTAKHLRLELKRIQRTMGIPTLYVTHELREAEELADRIAVLIEGRIEQIGRPHEVFFSPANEKVLRFIGAPNILECSGGKTIGTGLKEVVCSGMPLVIPDEGGRIRRIALFPGDIYVSPHLPPGPNVNRFKGVLSEIRILPEIVRLRVVVGETPLWAEMPHQTFEALGLRKGQDVFLIIKLRRIKADYE
ncbi:MAG: ABC transporter ATP-binding protein [Deltaproteobacteria bacterium]|nr:ABC transporter ATP-binding protein [Deltaproteobacteria bacterium]